jgi:hypothetical protein
MAILLVPKDFHLFMPSPSVTSFGIFMSKEDVMYNWTLKTLITISTFGAPFKGIKDIHVLTLQTLVKACSPPTSFVMHLDFATNELSYIFTLELYNFIIFFNIRTPFTSNIVCVCNPLVGNISLHLKLIMWCAERCFFHW